MKIFDDGNGELPPLDPVDPAREFAEREIRGWSRMLLPFAILLPWTFLYLSFSEGTRKDLPFAALAITHIGLGLALQGRRTSRRALVWAGVGCYPLALGVCVLLQRIR